MLFRRSYPSSTPCRCFFPCLAAVAWTLLGILLQGKCSEGYLYTSNGSHILRVRVEDGDQPSQVEVVPIQGVKRPVGIAIDIHLGWLFWSDISPGNQGIYRSKLNGTEPTRIVEDVTKVNGLAVDWWSQHVYWTDEARQTIELSTYDGKNRHIILSTGLKWPRGITINPAMGWLYWSDQGSRSISVSRLDGSQRRTLVDTGLVWPNQLVTSSRDSRIYWVDAYNKTLLSCDADGQNIHQELSLQQTHYANPIFGLVLVNQVAFFTTWYSGSIYSVPLNTPQGSRESNVKLQAGGLTDREMFSLTSDDITLQPPGTSPCSQKSSSQKCSHLCLISLDGSTRCVCPSYQALKLDSDGKTCKVPDELLLYADKDHGHIGVLLLPSSQVVLPSKSSVQRHILASSPQPVAVGYDPIDRTVYWSDVKEERIYRVKLNGDKKEVFLNTSQGIGTVDGLFVDWHHRRLYFTNRGESLPTPEGSTFSWHRVEFIGLDKTGRRTIISDVHKPRAVTLDLNNNYVYYTDWGHEPKIIRTNLDGSHLSVILTAPNTSNPNGLAMQGRHLYVVDSNYDNRISSPFLSAYDTVSQQWTTIQNANVKIPFDLTIRGENQVLFTDWLSTESTTGLVVAYDKETAERSVIAENLGNPTGLFYSQISRQQVPAQDPCAVSPCSDLCVNSPDIVGRQSRQVHCLCSEGSGKAMQTNLHTCAEAEDFLLFTDLNTVRMISLDAKDRHPYILHYGDPRSNFVALTYDPSNKVIYWSDLSSKKILHGSLDGSWSRMLLQTDLAVDGMAFDRRDQRLYFTGYNSMTGVIVMVTVDGEVMYTQLVTNLDQPRAIVLDLTNNYMFWTEYGTLSGHPRVVRADLDGQGVIELESPSVLKWPNALTLTNTELLLADGAECHLNSFTRNGSYIGEVARLSQHIQHIFGMAVESDRSVAYLTDWKSNHTVLARLPTGRLKVLATNLYRPGAIILHRQADMVPFTRICHKGARSCSHIHMCTPETNHYRCLCPSGMTLGDDLHTCEPTVSSWQLAEDANCHYTCHHQAACARLLPTMQYECVCTEGYQGDGKKNCDVCPKNHYKGEMGNHTCISCPLHSTTLDYTGATQCYCTELDKEFSRGQCVKSDLDIGLSEHGSSQNFSSAEYESEINYDYPPPTFTTCPQNEVIELALPSGASEATLDVELYAEDYLGQPLSIEGNHPVPPGAEFTWRGRGHDGHQHVVYTAHDLWGQEATCQFTVYVVDTQPPRFMTCPDNQVVNTTGRSMRAFWDIPHVVDNVGVDQLVAPSWDRGWAFPLGTWPIMYRAYDLQGNVAWCNFTITVHKMFINCHTEGHFMQPRDGGVVCGPDLEGFTCHTFCDSRHHVLNPRRQYHSIQCGEDGRWQGSFPEDFHTRACLRKTPFRSVQRRMHLYFTGPCDASNSDLKLEIITAVIKLMKQQGLCPSHQNTLDPTCQPEHFHVQCGLTPGDRRYKRDAADNSSETDDTVRLDVVLKAGASVTSNLSSVEDLLNSMSHRIQEHFGTGVSFTVRGATYHSLTREAQMEPLKEECIKGTFNSERLCLMCPLGSYLPPENADCTNCPQGTYQDEEGAVNCKYCPDGATSPEGAYNVSQCYRATQSPPLLTSTRDIAILAAAVAAVLITICLIIVLCLRRQHQTDKPQDFPLSFKQNKNDEPYIMEVKTGDLKGESQDHANEHDVSENGIDSSSSDLRHTRRNSLPEVHLSHTKNKECEKNSQTGAPSQEEIPMKVHHRSPGKIETKSLSGENVYEVTIT